MNNIFINCLFDIFLEPYDSIHGEKWRFFGLVFLRIGVGICAFILFEGPFPLDGRLNMGISVSALFLLIGGILLLLNRNLLRWLK